MKKELLSLVNDLEEEGIFVVEEDDYEKIYEYAKKYPYIEIEIEKNDIDGVEFEYSVYCEESFEGFENPKFLQDIVDLWCGSRSEAFLAERI